MSYKLIYFDGRGRAELSRIILSAAGQPFEDERIPQDKWPARKGDARFNSLPNLVFRGEVYGQSLAIAYFLAREFGFYPKGNEDALKVDEAVQVLVDMQGAITPAIFEKDPAKQKELLKPVPQKLQFLEDIAAANGKKGYFVGSKLYIADLMLFTTWEYLQKILPGEAKSETDYKELKKIVQNVQSIPSVKRYLASRPDTPF